MDKMRAEEQYLCYAERLLKDGEYQDDRTGVGTYELFGEPQIHCDLRDEFPLLTSKKVAIKSVISELTWMLRGDTNIRYLLEHNNTIWNEWPFVAYLDRTGTPAPEQGSDEWNELMKGYVDSILSSPEFAQQNGELGPVYGRQWRAWRGYGGETIDQLGAAQAQLRLDKCSRRVIVSAWNVGDLETMNAAGLPPCHTLFQFNASDVRDPETNKRYLDMKLYQRSADWFLGVPFNMAQYALMLSAMAQTTDRTPRYFYHTFGSAHLYSNHTAQVREQLSRRDSLYDSPRLAINPDVTDIGDFTPGDFVVENYQHHPAIKAPVAI